MNTNECNSPSRVLFVDDEQQVLQGIARSLRGQRREWDMRFANSAAEALAIMEQEPMDVMVTDIRMPEMSGDALIEQVGTLYPGTVPMALSGQCSQEQAIDISRRGVRFLAKPCDGTSLIAAVTEAIVYRQQTVVVKTSPPPSATGAHALDLHDTLVVLASAMVRGGLIDTAELPKGFLPGLYAALAPKVIAHPVEAGPQGDMQWSEAENEPAALPDDMDDLRRRLGF